MKTYMAVDIGGTNIRVAVYPAEGTQALVSRKIPTRAAGTTPLERLTGLIDELRADHTELQAVAVGTPGFIDARRGVIIKAPNVSGWEQLPLRKILQERTGLRTALGNDANLAALGEWQFGAGQGHSHLLYITISTGIGGGVIMDGHLLEGYQGLATEMGHITVQPDGPVCGCGRPGHLEALAAGPAIARYVQERIAAGVPTSLTLDTARSAKEINQAALAGDALAREAFGMSARWVGRAIADYLHLFNPSIVILGGGVSRSGEHFLGPLRATLEQSVMSPEYLKDLTITRAALGDDAGLLGALALARLTASDSARAERTGE